MEKGQNNLHYRTHARSVKVPPRRIDGVYERPLKTATRRTKVATKVEQKKVYCENNSPNSQDGQMQGRTYQAQSVRRGSQIVHRVIHEYYQPTAPQPAAASAYPRYVPPLYPVQSQNQIQQNASRTAQPKVNTYAPRPVSHAPATPTRAIKPSNISAPKSKMAGPMKNKAPKSNKLKATDIIRYSVVAFFVVVAGFLAYDTWRTNQQVQNAVHGNSASAQGYESSADVNNPPMANGEAYPDYKVAADQPRIINIPSVNITARMKSVGLTSGNKIEVPADASFAGWYSGGSVPGQKGASFVTGHYNGPNAGGVFDNLNAVSIGAEIRIEMGDGTINKYKVVSQETVPVGQVDMAKALSVVDGKEEGLNIMTCAGAFTSSGFADRLTVYAERV